MRRLILTTALLVGLADCAAEGRSAGRGLIRKLRAAGYTGVARVLPAVVLLAVLLLPDPALARCKWYQDRGTGRWLAVCDSRLDTPRLGPFGSVTPDRPYVEPRRPGSALAPPGSIACQRRYVCDRQLRCGWRDICR